MLWPLSIFLILNQQNPIEQFVLSLKTFFLLRIYVKSVRMIKKVKYILQIVARTQKSQQRTGNT